MKKNFRRLIKKNLEQKKVNKIKGNKQYLKLKGDDNSFNG